MIIEFVDLQRVADSLKTAPTKRHLGEALDRVVAGEAFAAHGERHDTTYRIVREVLDRHPSANVRQLAALFAPSLAKMQPTHLTESAIVSMCEYNAEEAMLESLGAGLDAKITEESKGEDPVEKAERWLMDRCIPWEKGAAYRTAYINGRREEPFDEPVTPKPVEPVLDPKAAQVVEKLEREIAAIRKYGKVSIANGYILKDLAVDCGWTEPKPGLEPDELAAICAIARAAPTGDVEAYVKQQRKVLGIWDKASRKVSLGGLGIWSVLGMGALGMMMYDWGKKGDAK